MEENVAGGLMGMEEEVKKMTLKEFKKYCLENATNIVKTWDNNLFKLTCAKCGSKKVYVVNDVDISTGCGTPQTGCWTDRDGSITVKCTNCGNAMILLKAEDIG